MKHFMKIAEGIDMIPMQMELANNEDLWDANTLRTAMPGSPHAACHDAWLLFNRFELDNPENVIDDKDVVAYEAWYRLPYTRQLALDLLHRVGGIRLGRVVLTKLPVGKRIIPHTDMGAPASYYTRFQIAIQSLPGVVFKIEDEQAQFLTGQVWRINNRAEHSVENNSADDRITLIVDVRIEGKNAKN
jgi:hypothetical protein